MDAHEAKAHNRDAWDREVDRGSRWTKPVGPEVVAAARRGEWSVILTNQRAVPRAWFPDFPCDVLCLASGGGQQAPVLAAAGARVTVFDQSPRQLEHDALVAGREGLDLRIEQGDMEDLSRFSDASFDLVFNPASVLFTPHVRQVWREAARVLRPGGRLMTGFLNPDVYVFDRVLEEKEDRLVVRHSVPYSDLDVAPDARPEGPVEFSHTLTDLIGGQLDAGLRLCALYEDKYGGSAFDRHLWPLIATLAVKRE